MAAAEALTRPREERAQTLGGAVEAIRQNAADAIGRLLGECCALERLIGLRQGCGTGLLGVPQMPEHTAAANRRPICLGGETIRMLLVGEDIDRQRQSTSRQDAHPTG